MNLMIHLKSGASQPLNTTSGPSLIKSRKSKVNFTGYIMTKSDNLKFFKTAIKINNAIKV